MRTLSLALILAIAAAGAVSAAPTKKKDQSPPTAQPDTTLVAPDTTPPPPTFAVTTRPVEMAPIGTTSATAVKASAPAPAPLAAPPPVVVAAAPPEAPVVVHAEVCLRAEAPRAARAESSVKLAVDLLLQDLCGGEVDHASLYAHNLDAVARFTPQSERAAAGLGGAKVDPDTGEIVNPPAGDVAGALASSGFDRSSMDVPPQIRRFAAELVLEAKALPTKAAEPKKAH